GRLKKKMPAPCRELQSSGHSGNLQPKVEEANSGNFHRLAPFADLELTGHSRRQLARIQFSLLGQSDQSVSLIITEPGIRAGPYQNRGEIGVGQKSRDGLLEALFN